MAINSFERLGRKVIYENRWVNVYLDRVRFPNGRIIEAHHLLTFDHAAVMVVAQGDHGRYLMVNVSRYPIQDSHWEFPAGGIETGEDVVAAARRELLEETGHVGKDFEVLYDFHPLNGIANQIFYVVRCRVSEATCAFDAQEINAAQWVTPGELGEWVRAREIKDGYTLTAFLIMQTFSDTF